MRDDIVARVVVEHVRSATPRLPQEAFGIDQRQRASIFGRRVQVAARLYIEYLVFVRGCCYFQLYVAYKE